MNYYADERSTDYLAHYGVKGMRWGVRRAIATNNQASLDRHYRKAAKKLAKLQDIGNHRVKYGAKAAAYGAAAAGVGTIAVGGTKLVGTALNPKLRKSIADEVLTLGLNSKTKAVKRAAATVENAIRNFDAERWGKEKSAVNIKYKKYYTTQPDKNKVVTRYHMNKSINPTKDDLVRIGAGLAAAGLAAKSAQNVYRAKNADKYREKAQRWKDEMDDVFSGTNYEGHYEKTSRRQQRRHRRYY